MRRNWIGGVLMFLLCACQTLPTSAEWKARGDGYFKDGKTEKALASYNKALRLNDKDASLYASRGAAYFFKGDYAAAQEDFVKVLQINPYQVDGYVALGSALAAQGYYEDALKILNTGLILDPAKPETFFSRGGINFMLGKYDQAIEDYSYVLRLKPAADVYNARGATYLKMGNTKKAEEDFEMAKSGRVPEKLNNYTMID